MSEVPAEADVEIYIIAAETTPVRLNVNGRCAVVQVGVDAVISDYFIPALGDANVQWRFANAAPEIVGAIDPDPVIEVTEDTEVTDETTDTFDPEPLIALTIEEFEAAVAAQPLTADQLAKLRDAETDREKPRSGIFAIIDKAAAAQS